MTDTCCYCSGPIRSKGLLGRPWPQQSANIYCCYGCLSLGEQDRQRQFTPTSNKWKLDGLAIRLGFGLLIAGQSMIFGLAISLEPETPRLVKLVVQGTILAGTLLVLFLLGGPLFRTAWQELRQRRIAIEFLFLITLIGALIASMQSLITGQGPIYFEVISVLLVVYTLGKTIGARSRGAALAASNLWKQSINICRTVDGKTIDVSKIQPGQLILVYPGETIPVDGFIQNGVGFVSEAPMNGEPFPVVRRPGDLVLAGCTSFDASFTIEATSAGTERRMDQLLQVVEQARTEPASIQAYTDRLTRFFLPFLIVVAVSTFVYWTWMTTWQIGLFHAMSVLLVACPCALGLATPIVIWSTLNRLAERGLLVQQGDCIEKLASVDQILLDKTGTLTDEQFTLIDLVSIYETDQRSEFLHLLSVIQAQSPHPMAKAFANLAKSSTNPSFGMDHVRQIAGCGVEVQVQWHGKRILRIGRSEWVGSSDSEANLASRLWSSQGHRVDVSVDGQVVAIAVVAERLRDSATEALTLFQTMPLPVTILTGDQPERANHLGVAEVYANLSPEQKLTFVEKIQRSGGKPLMVGDGINDASALAKAHVGIALSSGTDLANGVADATLYHGDLRVLPWAVALCRYAFQLIHRNIHRSVVYNLVGILLAACGLLHPVMAIVLMVCSSLLVVWSSVRIGVANSFEHCSIPIHETKDSTNKRYLICAGIHFVCLLLQALLWKELLDLSWSSTLWVAVSLFLVGYPLVRHWYRSPNLSHAFDMTIGMLTLGNLGMLFGWWVDCDFTSVPSVCESCVSALLQGQFHPGMWLGMLGFANFGMLFLVRRSHDTIPNHWLGMFTGGNLGMLIGMLVGSVLLAWIPVDWPKLQFVLHFVGMTVGMIFGMLIGTELARKTLSWIR